MYYLVYGFLYLLSLLPMWLLYGLSDAVRWLLFRVFGYRRKVVRDNLCIAFPEKTQKEREKIRREFEKNFTDTFIETIKLFSASREFIMKRMTGDFDKMSQLYDRGLRCQVHMGHNFNWEWLNIAYGYYCKQPLLGVYMPLQNKVMDRIFLKLRSRTGTILIPATDMRRQMMNHRSSIYLLGLVADQVPGSVQNAWWLNFFNRPSPFIWGPEKGAHAGDIPVAFAAIRKKKRGFYEVEIEVATEHPSTLPMGTLTRSYRDFLERVIRRDPGMWLWSHRRWKHDWNPSYANNWIDTQPMP